MRVKGAYVHNKMVKAALGVKICRTHDLEKAIAGSRLLVVGPDDDEDDLKDEVMSDLSSLMNSIDTSGRGVCVQASTLGSLEALLESSVSARFPSTASTSDPSSRGGGAMLDHARKGKELAVILAFDVPVEKEAEKLAEELGIKIFNHKIIYHLENDFTKYHKEVMDGKKKEASGTAVWPCRLKTIACFAKRDPIILGCDIIDGSLRVGTPLCVGQNGSHHAKEDGGAPGQGDVARDQPPGARRGAQEGRRRWCRRQDRARVHESAKMFGRHFEENDVIVSHIQPCFHRCAQGSLLGWHLDG